MLRFTFFGIAGLVIVAELVARFAGGLGDPPLTLRDPKIEYLFAPSRCYRRFHNRVCYNQWSMRSPDFPAHKVGCERRLMVIGDSIVNGGSRADQDELATEVAKRQLDRLGPPTTVGNISAGSWGPANMRAYTDRFGWFDADVAVFIFNTEDLDDLPTFVPDLGPDFPLRSPRFALEEFLTRYLPGILGSVWSIGAAAPPPPRSGIEFDPQKRQRGIAELERLLTVAQKNVRNRVVFLHFMVNQLKDGSPIENVFREVSERTGATFVSLRTLEDPSFYYDNIHLSPKGQQVIGSMIADRARQLLPVCNQ